MEERQHLIGTGSKPVLILLKKEVPELFTPQFWLIYRLWGFFKNKMDPPDCTWSEIDPDIMEVIILLQNHFEVHFSTSAVIIQYLESIIKHIRALGGVK